MFTAICQHWSLPHIKGNDEQFPHPIPSAGMVHMNWRTSVIHSQTSTPRVTYMTPFHKKYCSTLAVRRNLVSRLQHKQSLLQHFWNPFLNPIAQEQVGRQAGNNRNN
mmetsp:Transcript_113068/g.314701  ORF Transcript_113068/g.314701 Transcript_113068/m.314701 type:complete len:107 (+) Transcript_113068:914-1234(+)